MNNKFIDQLEVLVVAIVRREMALNGVVGEDAAPLNVPVNEAKKKLEDLLNSVED